MKPLNRPNNQKPGTFRATLFAGVICLVAGSFSVTHSPAAENQESLAKAAQNPIANMISLPIQDNMDLGLGPKEGFKNTTNIQLASIGIRKGNRSNLMPA